MKYNIRRTVQFKKDVKRILKRNKDIEQLLNVIQVLAEGHMLPQHFSNHLLKGQYMGKYDCHLEPDWILIYALEGDELLLYRTGSHADLFK